MKNFEIKKEIWLWIIALLPTLYMWYVWGTLPATIPIHFDLHGDPNGWSDKSTVKYTIPALTIGMYALFTIIPFIDPKRKIDGMGNKYFRFKLVMVLFMSVVSFIILQAALKKTLGSTGVFLLIGALFIFLGNYLQTVKPNYFIGIRTPWTLENEIVWRKTHRLAGKLFFAAGILSMILPFVLTAHISRVFLGMVAAIVIIPLVYSFIVYKEEERKI